MKLSPWFSSKNNPPIRIGRYECRRCHGKKHYYDGVKWFLTKGGSMEAKHEFSWRGMLK